MTNRTALAMLFSLALVSPALAPAVLAASFSQHERCLGSQEVDPDLRIAACDDVIKSKTTQEMDLGLAYAVRANFKMAKQQYAVAIEDYDHAIELRPADVDLVQSRCWARTVLNRELEMALNDCNEAVRARPNNAEALGYRGLVYLRLELDETALSDFNAALEIEPTNARLLYARGRAKARIGDTAGAQQDFNAARAIDPKIDAMFERFDKTHSFFSFETLIELWRSAMKFIY